MVDSSFITPFCFAPGPSCCLAGAEGQFDVRLNELNLMTTRALCKDEINLIIMCASCKAYANSIIMYALYKAQLNLIIM